MAKTETKFLNMTLTLLAVTLVASASVSAVYEITKEPKARAVMQKKVQAIKNVVPAFDNNPIEEQRKIESEGGQFYIYPAKKDRKIIATAIETTSKKGFGGDIRLLVGFLPSGEIYDIAVLSHRETPGLGDKINKKKSNFSDQFRTKNLLHFRSAVKKDGGDVDGITAATISSRAFCDAVKRAHAIFQKEEGTE